MKKKLQLVLLSTDKATNLILDKGKLEFISNKQVANTINSACKGFNLHAISDENLDIGDYYIVELFNADKNYLMLEQVKTIDDVWVNNLDAETTRHINNCRKVIITTDRSLTYIEHDYTVPYPKGKQITVPTFTNDFLDTYIKKYNDGEVLEFVEVEYDCDHFQMPNKVIDVLKVNSDNTVDVSLIEDKLYTKKELVNKLLIYKADLLVELMRCRESNRTLQTEFTNNWIKQNL